MIKADFLTRFVYNDTIIVEISDEINLFISALNLYKNRILSGHKERR